MKRYLTPIVLAGVVSIGTLLAIPDRIGGFFFPTFGVLFEEHVLDQSAWEKDGLKGDWEKQPDLAGDSRDGYHLKGNAIVFGVKASEIAIFRTSERLAEVQIRFDSGEDTTPTGSDLLKILRKNIEAFTGSSPASQAGPPEKFGFDYKDFQISLASSSSGAIIKINPKPAT